MKKDATFFLDEIGKLGELIAKTELFQKDFPEDDTLPFMVKQLEHRKKEMTKEYEKIKSETRV